MPRFMGCGCMTMASGLRQRQALGRQAAGGEVRVAVGQVAPAPMRSFWMRSIMTTSASFEPGGRGRVARAAGELVRFGHQRRRGDDAQVRDPERAERMPGRARDARVADVADDRDREPGEVPLVLAGR